jgi:hypothetical protein
MIQISAGPYRRLRPALLLPQAIRKERADRVPDQIEAFAAKLEPALAKALLGAFQAQAGAVSLEAVVAAIESGDVGKVLALLGLPADGAGLVAAALQDATWAAGALGAKQIATRITGATFAFNQLNPRLIDWLSTYSLGLIRQINDTTKDGIRQYLTAGMTEGRNPRDTARQVRQVIGLTDRQAQAVKNFRKELETFHLRRSAGGYNLGGKISRAPGGAQVYALDEDGQLKDGILERRLRDFRFDGQLQRAMQQGKPLTPAQIDKMVEAYARKYLKYRSETIARTEALRTTNFGVQDAWRQAIASGTVPEENIRRQWVLSRDERLCSLCAPVPRMNPKLGVAFGQPFATPKGAQMLPPLHPNCRCTIWVQPFEPAQLQDQ